jgi:NO-binding membrane sensor protein with MHYT domain
MLAGASMSMGGIAVWCMHFVGNRAIVLGNGERELQIVYSAGFTVLSLFMAIGAFFLALWAVGSNESLAVARVVLGGTLAGFAICGMHYLGQAGIANYDCIYIVPYVVGAGVIAVGACITVLLGFYSFRSLWANAWWKRLLCAILLALAVSAMHWLAAIGTQYRLKTLSNGNPATSFDKHNGTIVLVIVLVR